MSPALGDGRLIWIDPVTPALRGLRRGDIVALRGLGADGGLAVKRVVGLAGERVRISEGGVWIDGAELGEPYLVGRPRTRGEEEGSWAVGAGEAFVLGDNRYHSDDGRSYGPVPVGRVRGIARPLPAPRDGGG